MTTETGSLAEARVGTHVAGKWLLDSLLGYGGSAAVYAATHRNGKRAALKILHARCVADEQVRTRFVREGYVANKIGHPGAVSVLDDDVAPDGTVYLVMELLEGISLERRGRGILPPMSMAEVVHVADALLDVLAKAHEVGVVHRDIKPANLFMTHAGELKVLDFGIARLNEVVLDGSVSTQTGLMMGTPSFMPPEQARARWNEVDGRTDLWATGATMISLMICRRPRVAETPNEELLLAMTEPLPPARAIVPNMPPQLAAVIDRAVAFHRDERWPSARAMQDALRAAVSETAPQLNALAVRVDPRATIQTQTVVSPVTGPRTGPHMPSTPPLSQRAAEPEQPHSLTTSRAVLHSAWPAPPVKRSKAGPVIAGLAVFTLALGGAGAFYLRAHGVPHRHGPPATANAPTTTSTAAHSAASEPSLVPAAMTEASASPAPNESAPPTWSPGVAASADPAASAVSVAVKPTSHSESPKKDVKPSPPRPQASGSAGNTEKYFDTRF